MKILLRALTRIFQVVVVIVCMNTSLGFAYQNQSPPALKWGDLAQSFPSLHPVVHGSSNEQILQRLIFGAPLFYYDPYEQSLIPGIVEYWGEVSPDPRIWILSVRDGITFQDGSSLKPEDIAFSILFYKQYTREQNLPYNPHLEKLNDIRIIGTRHVQIHLQNTIEDLSFLLSDIPVLSRTYYEEETIEQTISNIAEKKPMGIGPYRVGQFSNGSIITLERYFDHYNGPAEFTEIELHLYESTNQLKSDFITEELDFIRIINNGDLREISSTDTSFQIISTPAFPNTTYTLNLNDGYSDLTAHPVREAILKSLNKHRYTLSSEQFNIRSISYGPLPNTSPAFFENLERVYYNPLAARSDLERSGWRDSNGDGIVERNRNDFIMELIYPNNDTYIENLIQYIRVDLSEIGVAIEAQPLPQIELLERISQGNYQISLDFFHHYPQDIIRSFADYFLFFESTFHRNQLGLNNPETIRQLRRAIRLPRQDEATAIFHRIQDLYRRAATGTVLTYQHHNYYAINRKNVTQFTTGGRLNELSEWAPRNIP